MMGIAAKAWDGDQVRRWLERRRDAARLDQAAADRRGYAAQDDYDKAAAEEWACRALLAGGASGDRCGDEAAFAAQLKALLAQEEYRIAGIHDDRRIDRYIRATLRKIARMAKTGDGFANTLRYQD